MVTTSNRDLPKLLSRSQKRLNYWRQALTSKVLRDEQVTESKNLLDKFALLLARALKATGEADLKETVDRIFATERELVSLFEQGRLTTNKCPNMPAE